MNRRFVIIPLFSVLFYQPPDIIAEHPQPWFVIWTRQKFDFHGSELTQSGYDSSTQGHKQGPRRQPPWKRSVMRFALPGKLCNLVHRHIRSNLPCDIFPPGTSDRHPPHDCARRKLCHKLFHFLPNHSKGGGRPSPFPLPAFFALFVKDYIIFIFLYSRLSFKLSIISIFFTLRRSSHSEPK